jgi:hypothetical protein
MRYSIRRQSMADNLQKSGGRDRARIDIHQDHELRDWSKKFGVTPEQLKQAVAAVGTEAAKVEAHLRQSNASA